MCQHHHGQGGYTQPIGHGLTHGPMLCAVERHGPCAFVIHCEWRRPCGQSKFNIVRFGVEAQPEVPATRSWRGVIVRQPSHEAGEGTLVTVVPVVMVHRPTFRGGPQDAAFARCFGFGREPPVVPQGWLGMPQGQHLSDKVAQ